MLSTGFFAIKLFLQGALGKAFDLVRRYPLQIALIAAVAGLFWQQGRIERRDETISSLNRTIAEMQAKAKQARTTSVAIAKDTNDAHKARVADTRTRTDAYIAANRLRPQGCVSAPAEGENPRSPENAPAVPVMVAVSEPDVKTCGDLQAYAWSSFEWAQKLKAAGLAD